MKSKKSQVSYMKSLIIALAFIVIISIFIGVKIKQNLEDVGTGAICETSIKQNIAAHFAGFDFSSAIKCPTENIAITSTKDSVIKKTIADKMYACSKRYNRGKNELFGDETIYCDICYIIDFEKREDPILGLTNYLLEEKTQEGPTYMKYLSGYSTEESEDLVKNSPEVTSGGITIDPSKQYAAIFVYAKGESEIKDLTQFITKDLDNGIGIAAGTALVAGGTFIAIVSAGTVPLVFGIVTAVAGGVIALYNYFEGHVPEWAALTVFREYNQEQLSGLCKELPIAQQTEES